MVYIYVNLSSSPSPKGWYVGDGGKGGGGLAYGGGETEQAGVYQCPSEHIRAYIRAYIRAHQGLHQSTSGRTSEQVYIRVYIRAGVRQGVHQRNNNNYYS